MRQCARCQSPMYQTSPTEFECPVCGLVTITSYERKQHEDDTAVTDDEHSGAYMGIGSLYPAMQTDDD